ncbi:MAG: polyprenyl synthetase family protein [Halioglobus sp.]|nr:polyprenyl synthetase family protein [Halioglobus sp.]
MSKRFHNFLQASKDQVDRQLADIAANQATVAVGMGEALDPIIQAYRYVLTNGGKRVRPTLVYAAARAVGHNGQGTGLDHVACALEMIHTYSLIHDDLPAMDDDDVRRGRPSCHKAFDEATAILTGDALQAQAFELLANAAGFRPIQRVTLIKSLAKAAGLQGMVGGQAMDIKATNTDLSLQQLQSMHAYKTGAIIRAALTMGGIAADASAEQLSALGAYGGHIGLAFQVVDDILDVEGDTQTLGKTQGKDSEANKPTYVSLMGLSGAKKESQRLLQAAIGALGEFANTADPLREMAHYIVSRDC